MPATHTHVVPRVWRERADAKTLARPPSSLTPLLALTLYKFSHDFSGFPRAVSVLPGAKHTAAADAVAALPPVCARSPSPGLEEKPKGYIHCGWKRVCVWYDTCISSVGPRTIGIHHHHRASLYLFILPITINIHVFVLFTWIIHDGGSVDEKGFIFYFIFLDKF